MKTPKNSNKIHKIYHKLEFYLYSSFYSCNNNNLNFKFYQSSTIVVYKIGNIFYPNVLSITIMNSVKITKNLD